MGLSPFLGRKAGPRVINGPDQEPVNAYMELDRKCI